MPADGIVDLGVWQLGKGEEWETAPSELSGWDPDTDVLLRRELRVDLETLRSQTLLHEPASFRAVTTWDSSSTGMSGSAGSTPISGSGRFFHEATLPGSRVGGIVMLRTSIVLSSNGPRLPGAAWRLGSVLVEDRFSIALEGTLSMFPVEVIDFAGTMNDPDASWHLRASDDLEAPFLGSFRLQINKKDGALVSAIEAPKPSDAQQVILDDLHQAVAMLLLEMALLADEEHSLSDVVWPVGSAGEALDRVLSASGSDLPRRPQADLSARRTDYDGATRRTGHGRAFK